MDTMPGDVSERIAKGEGTHLSPAVSGYGPCNDLDIWTGLCCIPSSLPQTCGRGLSACQRDGEGDSQALEKADEITETI